MDENLQALGAAARKAIQDRAERDNLIARWRAAFLAANNRTAPAVHYSRGFFHIAGDPGSLLPLYTSKVRKIKLEAMAATLEARVAQVDTPCRNSIMKATISMFGKASN